MAFLLRLATIINIKSILVVIVIDVWEFLTYHGWKVWVYTNLIISSVFIYYNSFRRRCSAFDVFSAGINEIRRAIKCIYHPLNFAMWRLLFFVRFDLFFECVLFVGIKKHKQIIKTKTLNLKHKKKIAVRNQNEKKVFWYRGNLSLVPRFRAWWRGFGQSG